MKAIHRVGAIASLILGALSLNPAKVEAAEFRLGLITPPSHVWTQASNRFAEQLAAETKGEITVRVFPGGQLGSEADMMQQMQSGVLEMAWLTAAVVSNRVPSYFAWFTPFLLKDVEQAIAAGNTPTAKQLLAELEPLGIKGQGYMFAGMRQILMRSGEIRSEADLANKKIRIYPFPATQAWYQGARAVPTPVGLTEVYQSLNNGLLDGVDIDFDALVGLSLQQVASSLTVTNHMPWPAVVMIDAGTWGRLSPEHQKAFQKVLDDTIAWANEAQISAEKRHLEQLRGQIKVLDVDDPAAKFRNADSAFEKRFANLPSMAAFRKDVQALGR